MQGFRGWAITGWAALALFVLNAGLLGIEGWNEEGVRVVVRSTARTSVVLFLLAFAASSLYRMLPGAPTGWLLKNRRYLGVSFAISHFLHAGALWALAAWFPEPFVTDLSAVTLVGGGLAYVFIAAMTATSFDRSAAWLGPRWWVRLHTVGGYYVWIIFAQSYIPRAVENAAYLPVALALAAVLALRIAVAAFGPKRATA